MNDPVVPAGWHPSVLHPAVRPGVLPNGSHLKVMWSYERVVSKEAPIRSNTSKCCGGTPSLAMYGLCNFGKVYIKDWHNKKRTSGESALPLQTF